MCQVSSWVANIGEEFLTVHTNLGTSSTAAKEFCEDHGQLMDELKVITSYHNFHYINDCKKIRPWECCQWTRPFPLKWHSHFKIFDKSSITKLTALTSQQYSRALIVKELYRSLTFKVCKADASIGCCGGQGIPRLHCNAGVFLLGILRLPKGLRSMQRIIPFYGLISDNGTLWTTLLNTQSCQDLALPLLDVNAR